MVSTWMQTRILLIRSTIQQAQGADKDDMGTIFQSIVREGFESGITNEPPNRINS